MGQIYDPVSGTYVDDGSGAGSQSALGYGPSPTSSEPEFYVTGPIPDASNLDLPGQLPGIPGGGASAGGVYASDPSGINTTFLHPAVNPTPTGGYMTDLSKALSAAASGFSTYVKGSPSVAIPPPKVPAGGMFSSVLSGSTNWMVIGIVVVAGIGLMAVLAAKA